METAIVVALISAAASIAGAAWTFRASVTQKRADDLSQRKLERYSQLMSSISDLAVEGLTNESNARFARAVNTIGLTAPQAVIDALLEFQSYIQVSNKERSQARHDALLTTLVLEIRKSLELPFEDNPQTFKFRLVGGGSHRKDAPHHHHPPPDSSAS